MATNTGFNDLTNQFNNNMKGSLQNQSSVYNNPTGSDLQIASTGDHGNGSSTVVTNGMRGYSRGSKVSQKSNRGVKTIVNQSREFQKLAASHPNTAGSQKRQISGPTSIQQAQNAVINNNIGGVATLASKRSAAHQKYQHPDQPIEYVPMNTKSYASQNKDQSLAPGVGGLSVLNAGLNIEQQSSQTQQVHLRSGETPVLQNQKTAAMTEHSVQENTNTNLSEFLPKASTLKNTNSRQNLILQTNSVKQGNDFKIGKISKYQIQKVQQSSYDNQGHSQMRHPNSNQINNGGDPKKFMIAPSESALPNLAPGNNTLDQGRQGPGTNSNTNTRKMSLAAKSGQMQIFNSYSLSQNLNVDGANFNQLAAQLNQKQQSQPPSQNGFKINQQNTYHINVKNLHNIPSQGFQPPSSNSGLGQILQNQPQTLNPTGIPLGTRQYESYLGRRQVIEQQREKKQELLKQLEMGQRFGTGQSSASIAQAGEMFLRDQPGDINIQENNYGGNEGMIGNSPGVSMLGVVPTKHKRNSNYNGLQNQNLSQSNEVAISLNIKSNINNQNSISPIRAGNRQSLAMGRGPAIPSSLQSSQSISLGINSMAAKNRFKHNQQEDASLQISTNHYNNQNMQQAFSIPSTAKQIPNQEFSQYLQQQLSPNTLLKNQPNTFQGQDQPQSTKILNYQQTGLQGPSVFKQNDPSQGANIYDNSSLSQNQQINMNQGVVEAPPISDMKVNPANRIRKLENGRPHKVYDYMFIQMSNEQFMKEYAGQKIQILSSDYTSKDQIGQYNRGQNLIYQNQYIDGKDKNKFTSPYKSPDKMAVPGKQMFQPNGMSHQSPKTNQVQGQEPLNLKGLVQIKAYDSQVTEELPAVQCNLLPTQLDHLKVLICEQDDKNHPKLTAEASNRFEVEKQNQIKQYMEDIIAKLQQKDRRFKVTVKKKFVDDALFNSTSIRVASVYVIVINREKTYDPILNQMMFKSRKKISGKNMMDSSSEEDEAERLAKEDYLMKQQEKNGLRNSNVPTLINGKKRSMYDSDTNGGEMYSTSASSNVQQFKKLMMDKSQLNQNHNDQNKKRDTNIKKKLNTDENLSRYKYQPPVKDYSKYGTTKIKICQKIDAHNHHQKHPINILFNQYNEFVKQIFKNQKAPNQRPFNAQYMFGLARAIGMNLKKDAFSDNNMKSREHLTYLKEKLIFCFWKKLNEENRDIGPQVQLNSSLIEQPSNLAGASSQLSNADLEMDGETVDSSSNANNTPKSKNLANKQSSLSQNDDSGTHVVEAKQSSTQVSTALVYPPASITYKYFIGKGNNSIMVRSLLKNRYWWAQNDKEEMEKCNYCFTQNKKNSIMEVLPCKFPHKKSGIKNSNQNQTLMATPLQKSSKKKKNMLPNSEKTQTSKVDKFGNEIKYDQMKLYNKIEDNFHVNNKKALYLNMKNYYEALEEDVFDNLPLTFHVKAGLDDPEFTRFKNKYMACEEEIKNRKANKKQRLKEEKEAKLSKATENEESPNNSPDKKEEIQYYQSQVPPKNIWIIKPGENTNRGVGIQVAQKFEEIKDIIQDSTTGNRRTCIVQKYIHNPLLIHRRKFDIRTFVLMTSQNGNTKIYIYDEGYLRTSCREYSIHNLSNRLVHLTNDAVQKRAEDYGKFEPGNKLSYNEFQLLLDKTYPDLDICFERDIVSQMNKMTTDVFRACHGKLDPKRRLHTMEVFGLDFMIDDEFKPYLIEVNTNPCLELSCPLLARLIPTMLENALKISLDSIFLPPEQFTQKKSFIGDVCPENRFELVFDSKIDGPPLEKLFQTKNNIIIEMEEDELSECSEHDDE